ncbi:MAG TPA: BON domain-containing protein [Myxococcota bacterium]|nr:BON domain-containing protein [Myxococcota bacterium]
MKSAKLQRVFAVCLALGLLAGAAGCRSTQSAGTQIDDAWITTKVKSQLAADPDVSAMNVSVETDEGVVTLTGRVKTDEGRREAVKIASETDGVVRVRDLLEVGDLD